MAPYSQIATGTVILLSPIIIFIIIIITTGTVILSLIIIFNESSPSTALFWTEHICKSCLSNFTKKATPLRKLTMCWFWLRLLGGKLLALIWGLVLARFLARTHQAMQIFSLPFVGIVVSFGIGGGLTLGHWKADCISQRVDQLAIG